MCMAKDKKLYDAFFISPRSRIYPVEGKHIEEVIRNSRKYGLSLKTIKAAYLKYDEPMGTESFAREELIFKILSRGFIRVRIKNHTICCQVGWSAKKRYAKNIFSFLKYLKSIVGAKRYRTYALRVFVRPDEYMIDAFDMVTGEIKIQEGMK